jgi:predicted O-methyltransferase YrrM
MDEKITEVLEVYHELIRAERAGPREVPPGEQDRRLRAVGPATGQLINIIAKSLKAPVSLELGTSFGYSGIWLAEAARASGGSVITMELHGYKSDFAREMAIKAGLADHIDFRVGDAVQMTEQLNIGVDFVLMDLWKDLYLPCLNAVHPKLNAGAIIVADNISPGRDNIRDYVEAIRNMPDMASVPLPVGQGLEISRYNVAW